MQKKCFLEPWGFLEVLGTTVAEGAMGGGGRSRRIIRLFRNRRGGFCNWCFSSLLSAPARGMGREGLSPAGCREHPVGRRTSHGGRFAGEHAASLGEISALLPLPRMLWPGRNCEMIQVGTTGKPGDGSQVALNRPGVTVCVSARRSLCRQFYQACRTGIMDQALSMYFLLGWLGGDLLNLVGSFLADQLPLQVLTNSLGQLSNTSNSREEGWDGMGAA